MTEQRRDRVDFEGKTIEWARSPRLPDAHPRVLETGDDSDFSTGCGIGYVSYWAIRGNRLYLMGVSGIYKLLGDEPLFADWYSGTAIVGYGYDYNSHPIFQSLLHIEFNHGIAISLREESCLEAAAAESSALWTPYLYRLAAGENFNLDKIMFAGADINATNVQNKWAEEGMAPLHFACALNNKEAVKLFLANGADANIKNKEGKTPLDIALALGCDEVAEMLRRHHQMNEQVRGVPAPAIQAVPRSKLWHELETKLDLARAYREMDDKVGAREILKEVLLEGDQTQSRTAQILMLKISIETANKVEGFVRAGAQGNAGAFFRLGKMSESGDGILKDVAQAAEWYEKAAVLGHAGAQLYLGRLYGSGTGVPRDAAKAAEWLLKAAQWFQEEAAQGNSYAQKTLGDMYMQGNGVPQDVARAMEWYEKAATQGSLRVPD